MNGFCPNCEKETALVLVLRKEEFNVRGEAIPVEVEIFQCQECGEEFENPKSNLDPYEIAYREYRGRKGLLQPEEIREFRTRRSLTQNEFSKLLGIGIATLNRYENGALQSEAHERVMRLAMEPRNFLNIIENSRGILLESKKRKMIDHLAEEKETSWIETTRKTFGSYEADIFSGYRKFDIDKFAEAVKYFCYQTRVFKTKLMKLLFYADFGHFKQYTVSISGARYAHLPYGPVPDQFEKWLDALTSEEGIQKAENWVGEYPCEEYSCPTAPDLTIFSPSELRVLASVKEKFMDYSAKRISDSSHEETGYRVTENAQLISYEYAKDLSIDF